MEDLLETLQTVDTGFYEVNETVPQRPENPRIRGLCRKVTGSNLCAGKDFFLTKPPLKLLSWRVFAVSEFDLVCL